MMVELKVGDATAEVDYSISRDNCVYIEDVRVADFSIVEAISDEWLFKAERAIEESLK